MRKFLRKLAHPLLEARRLYRWPKSPPYSFTDQPRKSAAEMRADLKAWKAKYGSYSYDYFEYGADIVGRRVEEFMPYALFKKYRDGSNSRLGYNDDFNYDCVLGDKLIFYRLATSLGHPTPEVYAVLDPDCFEVVRTRARHAPSEFASVFAGTTGILKPAVGGQGTNIFLLNVGDGDMHLNNEPVSVETLFDRLTTKYIFQELVHQHPALARLNESSINTLRLITVRKSGGAVPLTVMLRVGRSGSRTDNASRGGLMVGAELHNGALKGKGVVMKGAPMADAHPDSDIAFDGYELPHFDRCIEAACAFHDDLYGFHSVGWDIAITESGPTIIEGNARWSGIHMVMDPNFVRRYLESLPSVPPTPYRHLSARLINLTNR